MTKFLLIDGQQRLTTIFILLATLRNKIRENDQMQPKVFTIHVSNININREMIVSNFLLLNGIRNQLHFLFLIQPYQHDSILRTAFNSKSRVILAYNYFKNCLDEQPDLDIRKARETLSSRFKVVSILLAYEDGPYRIFETLNSTGLILSQADLIGNHLFMKVRKEDQSMFMKNIDNQYKHDW
ncbi:MAG TPA: DUF262 domain-containing protein [Candidatus Nitrosopolaris sp.]|nr:DUF262 domain-containing protein [Candidatus Nitrosopolaris sp.]